jgi:hypothetical protein
VVFPRARPYRFNDLRRGTPPRRRRACLNIGQLLVYMADKYQARRAPQSPRELELTMRKNPIAARGLVDW